jgi:hypothetical protein
MSMEHLVEKMYKSLKKVRKNYYLTILSTIPVNTIVIWIIQLHLCLSISTGGFKKFESDIGVYFLGGMSLSPEYILYNDFFDHKGPMYYLWIFLLRSFLPLEPAGVGILILLTLLFWFIIIELIIYLYRLENFESNIIRVISSLSLFLQNSNSVISVFANIFTVISLLFLQKFLEKKSSFLLIMSALFISIAILTRVDYVLFILIFVFLLLFEGRTLNVVFAYVLYLSISISILLFISVKILFFSLSDYWISNWEFNFLYYLPKKYNTFEIIGLLKVKTDFALYLGLSGFLSLLLIVIFVRNNKLLLYFFTLLFIPTIAVMVSGSDKNYHFMILTPGIMFFMIKALSIINDQEIKRFIYILNFSLLFLCAYYFVDNYKCYTPNKCDKRNEVPLIPIPISDFYLNNAWIYIDAKTKVKINFTSHYLMAYDIRHLSSSFINDFQANRDRNKYISNRSFKDSYNNRSEFYSFLKVNLNNSRLQTMLSDHKSDYLQISLNDWKKN